MPPSPPSAARCGRCCSTAWSRAPHGHRSRRPTYGRPASTARGSTSTCSQVLENAEPQEPGDSRQRPSRPPMATRRCRSTCAICVTTHSAIGDPADADLNAQTLLGDAMRVLHDFGNRHRQADDRQPAAGPVGDPVLDPVLRDEFERLKIVLHPASARRSHQGLVGAVRRRISAAPSSTRSRSSRSRRRPPRPRPQPVETRRIMADVAAPPDDPSTPMSRRAPNGRSARCGSASATRSRSSPRDTLAERLYVRLGDAASRSASARPATAHPHRRAGRHLSGRPRPSRAAADPAGAAACSPGRSRCRSSPSTRSRASRAGSAGNGGRRAAPLRLEHGAAAAGTPQVTVVAPVERRRPPRCFRVNGTRLWHPRARAAEVIVGDAADPGPRARSRAIPGRRRRRPSSRSRSARRRPPSCRRLAPGDPPYPVAVQVDGAR